MTTPLPLRLLPGVFGLFKFAPTVDIPTDMARSTPCFIARTSTELSVIVRREVGSGDRFRLFGIELTFGTTETGILKRVADPLAAAQVWVLSLGTHDTDYFLVRDDQVMLAITALRGAGHRVNGVEGPLPESR